MWHGKCFKPTTIFFLVLRPSMKNPVLVTGSFVAAIYMVSLSPTS